MARFNIILAFVLAKVAIHLATANTLGFHRDEFLYLALGRRLDWGFWSNPPFIGLVAWVSQHLLGDSLLATRFFSALGGGALVGLTGLMVRDFGGGRWAQVFCGLAMLLSTAWLRAFSMLQPVPFDILFWALTSFTLLRYLKTDDRRWAWALGAALGVGLLNKYTVVFLAAALFAALLAVPQRKVLVRGVFWQSAGLTLLIFLPNLWWQWSHGFPVRGHMTELAESQLNTVEPVNFLLDQLLMHGLGLLIWLAGLVYLLRSEAMRPYRVFGWLYLVILAMFLALSGKAYYTLGAYPVLFAAGGVFWEKTLHRAWLRLALPVVLLAAMAPLVPVGLPIYPAEKLAGYFRWLGLDAAVRWEKGNIEALPQDYADMLGWPELAAAVDSAVALAGDRRTCLVYAENYGQAGAVEHLSRAIQPPPVVSFSDSYRLWVPDTLSPEIRNFLYINDELGEDVQSLFADIRPVGGITNPLARERGTTVYLCRQPREDFAEFWAMRVKEVKTR